MAVWALANMKGGVGKTTSAWWLGRLAAEAGLRTLLVDLDLNGQLSRLAGHWPEGQRGIWSERPAAFSVTRNLTLVPAPGADVPLDADLSAGKMLAGTLADLAGQHDLCILDTPSGYFPSFDAIMAVSDAWIVPTMLNPLVRQASAHYLLRMARLALQRGHHTVVRCLPVRFNPHLPSQRVGFEALKRFVGAQRVLPPVRQHARIELRETAERGIRKDYEAVFQRLYEECSDRERL